MKHPLRTLLLAVCCGLAAACTQRQERLKLMSYNIRNGIGIDNIQDIGRIARVILREAPDLVALQELDSATLRVDGRYIPGELGRMTGMHATFGRAIGFAGGSYGIGLLSRTEPLAVRSIPLPGREEARVLLMAEFPDYTVCITHLSLTPEDRLASLPIIREATDTCRKPVLLAGDFNTGNAAAVLAGLGGGFRILTGSRGEGKRTGRRQDGVQRALSPVPYPEILLSLHKIPTPCRSTKPNSGAARSASRKFRRIR